MGFSHPCYSFFFKEQEKKQARIVLETISLEKELAKFKSSIFVPSEEIQIKEGEVILYEDFISVVRANHPDIIAANLEKQIASSRRLETQGAFDPSINSRNFYQRFNSTSNVGEEQTTFTSDTSLDFLTRYGADVSLGAKFAQGDIVTPISPTGDAGEYFVQLQVPLLRDAIYNSANVREKSAKLNEVIADFLLYRAKLGTLSAATKSFWDWVASKHILDIENNLLKLLDDQVDFVQEQADLGNLPQIDVIEAEREYQRRQAKVQSALRSNQESSIDISKYIWTDDGVPYSIPKASQVQEELPTPVGLIPDDIQEAKLTALEKRPEFKAVDLSREISVLERKLAKNQMLPQLDAFINSGVESGDDSIGSTFQAGVLLSLPLRVRTAKGQMQQAELSIQKLNLQERQLIQNVFLEIEDLASQIDTSYERYIAAKENYELSQKLEEGERDRFELGDSTLFLVIRRQRATVEAYIDLISTISDYSVAKTNFELAQGLAI